MMEENKYSSEKQTHRRSKKTKTIDEIETLSSGETTCHIPQEIIQEILVRLPVKSLLRFKCVAKSWLALISSSKFIKIHLKYSTNLDPTLSNYRIMFSISPTDRYDVKCRSVSSVYCDFMSSDAVDVDFPSTQTNWVSSIVGSCDGLLCVGVYDLTRIQMFLWNPCLRMSKKLPLPITKVDEDELWECTYGIGYDVLNDDYKVAVLFWDNLVVGYLVEIYSLKNDSWKRIENFKGRTDPSRSSMIYANGKLHFLAYLEDNDTSVGKTIVSLDLGNEVYGIVEHPEVDQPKYNKYHFILFSIEVLKGCISALYSYYAQDNKFAVDYADLWVLKEYGVKESWTKLARISRFHEYIGRYYESHILGILTNGKLLLGHGKCDGIFVYNPEDNSFIRPQICNLGPICSTGIYVESLVPLPT